MFAPEKLSLSPPNYVTHCKTVDKNIFWKNAFLNEGTRFVECWRFHLPWHKHSTFRVSLILRCFGLWDPPSVGAKNFVVKKSTNIYLQKTHAKSFVVSILCLCEAGFTVCDFPFPCQCTEWEVGRLWKAHSVFVQLLSDTDSHFKTSLAGVGWFW